MEVVPKDVAFAVAKLEGFNKNTYRLETNGATTAGPNSIITLSLPSNAIIDLRSFKVHLDVQTTSDATSTNAIYAKLPADTSSLISQCEVYCGGVQIAQGFSEFNTVSRVKKLVPALTTMRRYGDELSGMVSKSLLDDIQASHQR